MAIYYRTIKIDGVTYKQISPTQWQNLNTGQILDNTKITVIVNEFKSRQAITVPTVPTGACCTGGTCFGGGQATPSECSSAGGVFYAGSSCFVCDSGVYCTGSGVGQTCFGLGHRGQSLTNNFIVGGSCSSCILGACCTGGTCLGGGITNQAACIAAGGLFYPGSTCTKCDFGVYCTGSNCLSLGYRGEQLTNNFIVGGTCAACIIGACCETVNGVMQCSEKSQQECSNGCFKGAGSTCGEASSACSTCVHCCFAGGTCTARTPEACLQAGGTYFAFGQGCTSCRYGVCSSDTVITQRFFGNGCTGTFIVGGVPSDLDFGVFCTGSGVGQTCAASGYRYQQITNNFIAGASCSSCILGACCTGGGCLGGGLTSQAACAVVGGLFYPGATCAQCDVGVFCTGLTTNRTCIRTGYRGEALSNQFQVGATCAYCITGTCCVNGNVSFGDSVRQSNCTGRFFPNQFLSDACEIGSCCLGAACTENVYKYDCFGTFNFGMTCMACSNGACCLPAGGGCTLATFASCFAQGGTFFGGATCAACDQGSCCHGGNCNNQRRGNACLGSFYANQLCDTDPCAIGACCVGNTCAGINFSRAECNIVGGDFHSGSTCIACFTGANCITPENPDQFVDRDCSITNYGTYRKTDPNGYFGFGKTCADCEIGSCCNPLQEGGGGTIVIRGSCSTSAGYNFFKGQTLIACDTGVYCTGASLGQTCFGLGYRGQSLTSNFIIGGNCNDCILGSCCTGGTCLAGGLTSQSACNLLGGIFFGGRTCDVCQYGVYCTGATCFGLGYRGQSLTNNFIAGASCSSCILGACCTGGTCLGGGQTSQAACSSPAINGLFYPGTTCISCDYGIYCTGATCFDFGYRAQALTNNFIMGASCSSCILGACCTGGTCLGGGQTSQAACVIAGGTFYPGSTCFACVNGVFCTGSGVGQTCFGLGHRGQSLTNNFIAGASCSSCILGACCTGGGCLGNGLTSQAACSAVGGLFYPGTTCISCDYGVYCTGSNESTSCLGLGYRAQNLSNQFVIAGNCATDCTYGSCCQGTTCLGITNQGNCPKPNSFFPGSTCFACDAGLGACCTGGSSSITTVSGCQAIGGIFFPEGTTALCITGSCCTGGTCIQEFAGRSLSCDLFISGATCGICDSGVFCTGATCLQVGFRGQSLATVFLVGETCGACIEGICCKDDYEYSKVAAGRDHFVLLSTQGEVRGFGGNTYGQAGMTFAIGYTAIAVGAYHTLALSQGGTVSAWGRNQYGQATVPTGLTGVVQISAGEYHSLALTSNGGVTCWGWNGQGQCNVPSGLTGVTMIASGMSHNLAMRSNGTVVAWGYNFDGQANVPAGLTGVVQVAAGYYHSLALLSNGGITCWGMTAYGQCNIPAGLTASKIVGGGYHTLVLLGNGGVTGFGRNSEQQIEIPSLGVVKEIGAGDLSSFAITTTNDFYGWKNIIGQDITTLFEANDNSCDSLNLKNCNRKNGIFRPGATDCSVCDAKVNCCAGGTCSYILAEECTSLGGIAFAGAEDCTLCNLGAFCTGNTCAGITLKGFNITDNFIADPNCDVCITGVCCDPSYKGTLTSKSSCTHTFYPGTTNIDICTLGKTFGICCNAITNLCTEDIEQSECSGYFISNEVSVQNGIYCSSNPCEYGACCGQNSVTSITGGVCLGIMRRAECSLTGGEFFAASEGYTCSNCIYTPMLGSALFNQIGSSDSANSFKTTLRLKDKTGWTGNEIQPRLETALSTESNTWLTWTNTPRFYQSVNITTGVSGPVGFIKDGAYMSFSYLNLRYSSGTPFRTWYGVTLSTAAGYGNGASANWQGRTGFYDYSPVFESGFTRQAGFSFGYIDGGTLESPRYMRMVLGYSDIESPYNNKTMVFRYSNTTSGARKFSRTDATRHALLDPSLYNLEISDPDNPFANSNGSNIYATPVLVQFFGENPLSRRIRPMGSCCKGRTCMGIVTQDHCTFIGGTFNVNANCARCYPDLIFGNCCTGGTHGGYTSLANCNRISGTFFEGTTFDSEPCKVGIICNENRTCYEGISYSYYGDFSSVDNKFFVEGDYRSTVGCAACDAGICCTGGTCLGVFPRTICEATGGKTTYLTSCGTEYNNCELGVCCPFEGGCGVYTSRGECVGEAEIFIAGATLGATCSACNSLMKLTQYTPGVTYTFVFNKGTTYGRFFDGSLWLQETNDLRVRRVKINYVGMTAGDKGYTFYANTVIPNKIVHPSGYRGTLYAHGAAKNLQPFFYVDSEKGIVRDDSEPFTSLSYEDYNSGWKGPRTPGATEKAANYKQFNLPRFLEMKNQLDNAGVTLSAGDLFIVNATNFNPYREETTWKTYTTGYPYQLFYRRANTLTYGILNCVGATTAAFINSIGSTLCFRPPTTWPLNDKENRPIYKLSDLDGRIPGETGIPLVTLTSSGTDKDFTLNGAYPMSDRVAASFTQVSEYGGGQNYGTTTPIWSMHGARSTSQSYGDQYLSSINRLHQIAYATGPAYYNKDEGVTCNPRVSIAQRKDMIARVVQYGIDSWGAQRAFTVLGAGAGQKSARTRPWVSIAGYYLGVTGMYDPEATMLQDTKRMQKWSEYLFTDEVTCSPKGDCVTDAEWRRWRIGGSTGSDGNFKGLRRQLAQWNENAALTTYEYTNNPNNPILHYDYVGKAYRLGFKDHSPTGLTGITFYNETGITRQISERIKVNGNFGVIRWGSETGATTIYPDKRNPFVNLPYYDYDQKAGVPNVFTHTWLRVVSGPGSSGGQGSRYYRIIQMNPGGFMHGTSDSSDSRPMPASGYPSGPGGGYQIVIGQTWADGIPDHTSYIQIYPFIESDFGITRPCLHCASGFTSGTIPGFISVGNPDGNCGVTFAGMPDCMLWDANAGVGLYYSTTVSGWVNTFYFLKHIMTTKGITLISDAFPVTDYMDMRFYTSPYNLFAFDQIESGSTNNTVLASWMPQGIYNAVEITKRINFAKHFPGIRKFIYGLQDPVTIW